MIKTTDNSHLPDNGEHADPLRFRRPHEHLSSVFGNDWLARKSEAVARFFGTPLFLGVQTVIGSSGLH
jgi:uncharacterized membrane protein